VLANARRTPPPDAAEDGEPDTDPAPDADTRLVLTALAYAVEPLTVDDLATVLDWPMHRVTTALDHAENHPEPSGPVALRRTEPDTYTVTARLDQLPPSSFTDSVRPSSTGTH
jgi:hypothetical protein